jgi:hypothetical protein
MHDSSLLLAPEKSHLLNAEADNQTSLLSRLTKTSIGRRSDDGSLKVGADEPHGYVLTGPLCRLATGSYRLDVRCSAGTPRAADLPVLGVEAVATTKGPQAWRDFTADELKGGHASIEFFVQPDFDIDPIKFNFKFYHFGNSDLEIADVKLTRLAAQALRERELPTWRLLPRLRVKRIATRRRDGVVAIKRRARAECFLDGPPSFMIPEGRYRLKIFGTVNAEKRPGQPVLGVEIMARKHQVIWRDLAADAFEFGPATFDFIVPLGLAEHPGEQAAFNFVFYHLGNSDLAIRAVELSEIPDDAAQPVAPPEWRVLGRLQKSWRAGAILNGGPGRNARWMLHGLQPHLKLPAGRYSVRIDGDAGLRSGSSEPAISVDVAAQGVRPPPRRLRPLFEAVRWRIRGTIATVATRQFTAAELNDGECTLDFDVPFEWSIASGANIWFDLRIACLSKAPLNIKNVRISAAAQPQDGDANLGRQPPPTSVRSSRKSVLVIGNCQAEVLSHQLRALPLSDRIAVNFHFFDLPEREIEEGKTTVGDADLVLIQDIRNVDEYPLKDYIRSTARIVKFPCLRFASLWPFDGLNGLGDPEAVKRDWPELKFPYLDGALARLRKETPDREERFAKYAALKMDRLADPKRMHAFEERRLLAMDREFQCEIGQFILENFRTQRLFHTTSHPHGKLFAMLLDQLFSSLEIKDFVPSSNEIDRYLNAMQVPVHPMVGKILGVKWATEKARYLFDGEQVTWETYVRRYIGYYG